MKTIRLLTCDDSFKAHLVQDALEQEGIASVLHNEHMSDILRGLPQPLAGVDVFVYEADFARAVGVLRQRQLIPGQLKCCPCCHSPHIRFVWKRGHRVRAFFAALLSALAAATPGTAHWEYVCDDCGARFARPVDGGSCGQNAGE